jgi:protein-S-isoprenylcysteine O-methyltransferase Ste14
MRTLGRAYSRTLRTERERVVEAGPYRHVRHPGYLGSNLIWLGFA